MCFMDLKYFIQCHMYLIIFFNRNNPNFTLIYCNIMLLMYQMTNKVYSIYDIEIQCRPRGDCFGKSGICNLRIFMYAYAKQM